MTSAVLTSPSAALSFPPDVAHGAHGAVAVAAPPCLRVLVAEDQPLLRRIMVRMIQKLGHQAIGAENGTRAWELFVQRPSDVVITDWLMPGMDGLDLCRRLRAEFADLPYVILASVLDDPQDVQDGLSAGADEYLVKPIATDDLAARLSAVERMITDHARRKNLLDVEDRLRASLTDLTFPNDWS
jgi:DNA-binding response OmpR family regulator